MNIDKIGQIIIEGEVSQKIFSGDIFGIKLKLFDKTDGWKLYRFLIDKYSNREVVGRVDLGNGQWCRLSVVKTNTIGLLNYEAWEMEEEADTSHVMD